MFDRVARLAILGVVFSTAACSDEDVAGTSVVIREGSIRVPIDESGESTGDNAATLSYSQVSLTGAPPPELLVIHFGGPGSAATELLPEFIELFPRDLIARFAIVAVDELGVGASSGFGCDALDERAFLDDGANAAALFAEHFSRCTRQDLLGQAGTQRFARDLERLRVALGAPRVHFLGYSYGTLVALSYAALYPETTGRVVLDSPADPRVPFAELAALQLRANVAAYEAYFDWCEARVGCSIDATDFTELLEAVEASGSPKIEAGFSTLEQLVRSQYAWPLIEIVFENARDDLSFLAEIATPQSVDGSALIATQCSDSPVLASDDISAIRTRFENEYAGSLPLDFFTDVFALLEACVGWERREPEVDWAARLAEVDSEVLIVGATGDTQTPAVLADGVQELLPNAQRVEVDEIQHTYSYQGFNPCVDDAVHRFLTRGDAGTSSCDESFLSGVSNALQVLSIDDVLESLARQPRGPF